MMKKFKLKLNENVISRLVYYNLLVDNQVVVRTISKDILIEQYEFQRSIMHVSVDRIRILRDVHIQSEFMFN